MAEEYQKEFELLLKPATFPSERLEMSELLNIYYPNLEDIADGQQKEITISAKIVDQTWSISQQKVIELTEQELKNSPDEEKLKALVFNLKVSYNSSQYSIFLSYHPQSPFINELQEIFTATPLQLENELLKKENEQLPTPENFEKLTKQNQAWENAIQDLGIGEEEYLKIKEKINEIK